MQRNARRCRVQELLARSATRFHRMLLDVIGKIQMIWCTTFIVRLGRHMQDRPTCGVTKFRTNGGFRLP
ncbi:hypothetical protein PT2222_440016 [Paraburkholderia tropica]